MQGKNLYLVAKALALAAICVCFATMAHAVKMDTYSVQFFDANGRFVIRGVTAYVFAESTQTQVPVYDLQGNPLTQPLEQDLTGRVSFKAPQGGSLWVVPSGAGVISVKDVFTPFYPDSAPYIVFGPQYSAPASPDSGYTYFSPSAGGLRVWDGSSWVSGGGGSGIASVSEDTSPQLGGNLNVLGFDIVSTAGIITLSAKPGDNIVLDADDPGQTVTTGDAVIGDSLLIGGDLTLSAGNIYLTASATVDGRDVSADGATLDALGSAASEDVGTAVGDVPQLVDVGGGTAGLPAVDGSNLTGISGGAGGILGIDSLRADAWQVLYSDGSGVIQDVALGTSGTYLQSQGASSVPTWSTPAGSGDVTTVGTPVNDQVGVWTGDGTLEGDADFTFDGENLTITGSAHMDTLYAEVVNGTSFLSILDDAYGDGWNGATSYAPSQNAVFDKMLAVGDSLATARTYISSLDTDLPTLSLPASTTISAFGATVVDDADASTARATLDVDQAGTDNSTDVTLAGSLDYLTLSGQQITRGAIDLSTDVSDTLSGYQVNVRSLTENASPASGDWFMFYDTSASAMRKVDTDDLPGAGGSGDVTGPGASTDNGIALWDGTGGDTLKDSGITISAGILSGLSGLACPDELYLDGTGGGMLFSENYASDVTVSFENSGAGDLDVDIDGSLTVGDSLTVADYTLPLADGTNGQVIQTNGSGVLSFASAGSSYKLKDKQSLYRTSPTATDTLLIGVATVDCTIDSIRCTTDTGTVDYDILTRGAGTPFSGGTQVIGTDDQASSTSSLAAISDGDYNAGEVLTYIASAVSGSPGKLLIVVYFSED